MTTEFEYKGRWRLPQSDEWINGTISFNPENKAKLELFGTFSESQFDRSSKDIILGETTEGYITLLDNYYKGRHDVYQTGITIGVYEPSLILIGQKFEDIQDISFRNVTFRAFNLFQWLDITGINKDINYLTNEYVISYKKIANIKFEFTNRCKGEISFNSPINFGKFDNKIELSEQCYVTFKYKEKIHFEEILNDIFKFIGFITFFTFEQSYPIIITFEDEDYFETIKISIKETKRLKPIRCYYQNSFYNSKYELQQTSWHLVKYENIKHVFPQVLEMWYNSYNENKLEPVFNLLLNHFKDKYLFSVDNFMDSIRAIETFHRRTYKNIGKELNLSIRLIELLERTENLFIKEEITNFQDFIKDVLNSRNYYTHFDKEKEKKALKGKELFEANRVLIKLLFSSILAFIGLENSHFEEELKRLLN